MADTKKTNEPLFWALFGTGGTLAALFVVPIVIIFGVMMPGGLIGEHGITYEAMRSFVAWWPMKLLITAVIFTTLWQCCHRIYHGLHDVGIHPPIAAKAAIYGIAVLGGLLTFIFCIAA